MVEKVNTSLAARAPARWSVRRPGLLLLLVGVVAAAILFQVSWRGKRSQELSGMTTSDLRIAAKLNPNDADIRMRLAERYLWEERIEDSLREAQRATELAPHSAQAWYLAGKTSQRASRPEIALRALERAVALDPHHVQARFLLGHGYYWHEQPLKAIEQLTQYVEQQPADDVGFRFLGLAYLRLGRLDAAEPALKRAVELGPDASGNRQALGNFYLNRAQGDADLERAAAELLKAVELNPTADTNRMQAAIALQRLNRLPEAAAQFEAVFAQAPTDEKVCYALLQIYTRLKDEKHSAQYRQTYEKIVKARNAKSAITANEAGGSSYPTR